MAKNGERHGLRRVVCDQKPSVIVSLKDCGLFEMTRPSHWSGKVPKLDQIDGAFPVVAVSLYFREISGLIVDAQSDELNLLGVYYFILTNVIAAHTQVINLRACLAREMMRLWVVLSINLRRDDLLLALQVLSETLERSF